MGSSGSSEPSSSRRAPGRGRGGAVPRAAPCRAPSGRDAAAGAPRWSATWTGATSPLSGRPGTDHPREIRAAPSRRPPGRPRSRRRPRPRRRHPTRRRAGARSRGRRDSRAGGGRSRPAPAGRWCRGPPSAAMDAWLRTRVHSSGCACPCRRLPRVTPHAGRLRRGPAGLASSGQPRLRPLRDPRGLPPARRHAPVVGLALAPQARRPRPRRIDLVGAVRHDLVDGRAVRGRLRLLRAGLLPALCHRGRRHRGQRHLLHRVHLLHDGLLPAVHGGGVDAVRPRAATTRRSDRGRRGPADCCGSAIAASTGGRRPSSCSGPSGSTGPR